MREGERDRRVEAYKASIYRPQRPRPHRRDTHTREGGRVKERVGGGDHGSCSTPMSTISMTSECVRGRGQEV